MTQRTRRLPALALAAVLTLSACGADGDDTSTEAAPGRGFGDTADTSTAGGPADRVGSETGLTDGPTDAEEGYVARAGEEGEEADAGSDPGRSPAMTAAADAEGALSAPADGRSGDQGGFFGSSTTTADPSTSGAGTFAHYGIRPFVDPVRDPLSTFALDVDTASYTLARRWVDGGAVPPVESVRVEEYVNSFDYDYPAPRDGLAVVADGGPSPFDPDNVIVRLGVQAERVSGDDRGASSLTFVVDTSGSMDRSDRLGLVRSSLRGLVGQLGPADTVAIVTYADDARVVLEPTPITRREEVLAAIDQLRPTGSTNLEAGLRRGYELAAGSFRTGGVNRVILASDGVANVGMTDPDALVSMIRDDADRGIQLVTVGVGMGSFNDVLMEQLANDGDGFYAYVNDEAEAARVFGDDVVASLLTVALDAKIQVEFDAEAVSAYRLIGFENRAVRDDDFRNDTVDAGELGAGHQVTALYELTLRPGLRSRDRLGTVQLRWEDPTERRVRETRLELTAGTVEPDWSTSATDLRLAVTAAALGELLRESPYVGDVSFLQVAREADSLAGERSSVGELADLARRIDRLT